MILTMWGAVIKGWETSKLKKAQRETNWILKDCLFSPDTKWSLRKVNLLKLANKYNVEQIRRLNALGSLMPYSSSSGLANLEGCQASSGTPVFLLQVLLTSGDGERFYVSSSKSTLSIGKVLFQGYCWMEKAQQRGVKHVKYVDGPSTD